jgi:hypothetical protein
MRELQIGRRRSEAFAEVIHRRFIPRKWDKPSIADFLPNGSYKPFGKQPSTEGREQLYLGLVGLRGFVENCIIG